MTYANVPRAPHLCLSNLGADWQKTRIIRTHVILGIATDCLAWADLGIYEPKGISTASAGLYYKAHYSTIGRSAPARGVLQGSAPVEAI